MIPHLETLEAKTLATLLRLYTHGARGQTLFQDSFPIKSLCHVSTLYVTFCIKLDNLFFVCINFLAWTDSQSPDSCGEPLTHRQDYKFWLCFRERCQTGRATQTAPA